MEAWIIFRVGWGIWFNGEEGMAHSIPVFVAVLFSPESPGPWKSLREVEVGNPIFYSYFQPNRGMVATYGETKKLLLYWSRSSNELNPTSDDLFMNYVHGSSFWSQIMVIMSSLMAVKWEERNVNKRLSI